MTIERIHDALKKKKFSVSEFTREYIQAAKKIDETLNSFISFHAENALKEAEKLDTVLSQENPETLFEKYPLFGIPSAHKDLYSTEGMETTAGSHILKGYIPPYNATAIERIKKAGAIIFGKLNQDAFGHGSTGNNSDFGPTKNPYNTAHVPGGSSSGGGASVSSRQSVFALGTDTGSSVRSPAGHCNIVGIKPSYGRVSRYGVIAMASSLDSIGHLSLTVEDCARVLSVTAGYDANDATSQKTEVPAYEKCLQRNMKGLKIGVPKEYFGVGIDSEVEKIIREALEVYKKLGAELVPISLPLTDASLAVYYIVQPSEVSSNLARFDGIRFGHDRNHFGNEAKRRIMIGTYSLSSGYYDAYYLKAQKVRNKIIHEFSDAFEKVDIIAGPVSPDLPTKIGEFLDDPLKNYLMDVLTVGANLAGIPALSVPAGFSKAGLPVGLQLIGSYFDEETLFQSAFAFERETEYWKQAPPVHSSVIETYGI